jgi:GR25 family glycosyltransferase involved in LPS biosynthesis
MTDVLVFNEENKNSNFYKYLSSINDFKIIFIESPEEYDKYTKTHKKTHSSLESSCESSRKILSIIVDDLSFFVNIYLPGCVYLKFSTKQKASSVNQIFFYNIIINANIQGVFVPTEEVLYELCDRVYPFFLKSRRNKNGNFMLIDESSFENKNIFLSNEIKFRLKSDLYNFYLNPSNSTISSGSSLKTLVINLEKDRERKKNMMNLLPEFHKVEFEKAVYGKEHVLSKEEKEYFRYTDMYGFQKKNPYGCTLTLKPGEIGCALSHINVWKKIVSMAYTGLIDEREPIFVFEDDIQLSENYPLKVHDLLSELPLFEDWHVCFIGVTDDIPGIDFFEEKNFNENKSVSLIKINNLSKRTHWGGTFGYVINYYGAQKLLCCVKKYGLSQAIDWFMFEMTTEVNTYKTYPHLVTSEVNCNSNIQ